MGLREDNRELRRRRIRRSARSLVAKQGFEGLSMRTLARKADLSVTTLYNLYGSKDEIRLALCHELLDGIDRALEEVPLERPLERARAVVTVSVDHLAGDASVSRAGILASRHGRGGIDDDGITPRAVEMQRVALEAAMSERLLRPDLRPDLLAAQVYDGFRRAALLWAIGELEPSGFRSKALYALYVCLLGVATDRTRPAILAELRALEPELARQRRNAA
jgi:AcrR family transcriptional regulator